jgi:3-oxoacyl-[acyl-carrier-protein] synthase-3
MTSRGGAALRSLAVAFPSVLRTNDYYRKHHAALVARAEEHTLAKLWGSGGAREPSAFDIEMAPYLRDPFRGAVERRIRAPGEPAVRMEASAAKRALDAAGLGPDDVDLVLVSSFVGDRFGVGDAAYLARELGIHRPAMNFETACSGSVVGLQTAASLVRSGDFSRVLVVVGTSNSVQVTEDDTLGWFIGDGAGAFVIERAPEGVGVLGGHTINSVETIDMFVIHSIPDGAGGTRLRTSSAERAGAIARETAEPYLRACVDGALSRAGVSLSDVDFWVFNTPNAWYAAFCGRVLGVSPERYHSVYPRYANIGAVLMPATLYHAIDERRVRPGQLVGLFSVGSTSTASAAVVRVGDVALGAAPDAPSIVQG